MCVRGFRVLAKEFGWRTGGRTGANADLATGRPLWIWHSDQPRRTADGRRLFLDKLDDSTFAKP